MKKTYSALSDTRHTRTLDFLTVVPAHILVAKTCLKGNDSHIKVDGDTLRVLYANARVEYHILDHDYLDGVLEAEFVLAELRPVTDILNPPQNGFSPDSFYKPSGPPARDL